MFVFGFELFGCEFVGHEVEAFDVGGVASVLAVTPFVAISCGSSGKEAGVFKSFLVFINRYRLFRMTHRIRFTNLPLTSPRLRTLRPENFLNINRLQRNILLSMMRVQGSIRANLIILISPPSHQLNHLSSPRLRVLKPQHRNLHILELPQKLRIRPKIIFTYTKQTSIGSTPS